jgi:hypothetical protein
MDHGDGDHHDGHNNGDGDHHVLMGHTVSFCECERTLMSPRGGVNRRDDQFELFLPKHFS